MGVPIQWVIKVTRNAWTICEWMLTCLGTVLATVGQISSRGSASAWLFVLQVALPLSQTVATLEMNRNVHQQSFGVSSFPDAYRLLTS